MTGDCRKALRTILLLVIVTLAFSSAACASIAARAERLPQLVSRTMIHDGLKRSYHLLIPSAHQEGHPIPLVLALHGGGGRGEPMCRLRGGVPELAEQERFLVACPDGIEKHWNDGRDLVQYRAHAEDIDDVGFLLALVERLSTEYSVDPGRIFVTGFSNGGKMSLRLACKAADTFAAAAPVIASLPTDLDCRPTGPISILLMNGTEDPLVPWEGGQVHFLREELGGALSTPDTIRFWVEANGCDPAPKVERLPDLDPSDGTRIQVDTYSDCRNDTQVILYTVEGGGHTWPGGPQYAPKLFIGRVSQDLHAGEAIWRFFSQSAR